jgi:hypothetical protein
MNTKLRKGGFFCDVGICGNVLWYPDLFRVMSGLALHTNMPKLKKWIYQFINQSVIDDPTLRHSGILCRKEKKETQNTCNVIRPKTTAMTRPVDIIKTAFTKFRYTGIKDGKSLTKYQPHVYASPHSRITNTVVDSTHPNRHQVNWNQLKK